MKVETRSISTFIQVIRTGRKGISHLAPLGPRQEAAGLEDEDLGFPSEANQLRPASGLARLLDTACRRARLPPIPRIAWGRLRDPVRPGFVAFTLAASSWERRGKK